MNELVRRLDSDELAVREKAQARLAKMGRPVRAQLLSALPDCAPEARARIQAVLQGFVLLDEEDFAVKHLALETPFPPSARRQFGFEAGEAVSTVLSRISRDYGIRIETFPGDEGLRRDADDRTVRHHLRMSRASARGAIHAAIVELEAFPLFDLDRVVLVRLTPAVLFEGLRRAPPEEEFSDDLARIQSGEDYWDRVSSRARSFLGNRLRSGGPRRERWLGVLKAAVLDPEASLETRCLAVQGFRTSYLMDDNAQPDSTDFLVEASGMEALPVEVRREALLALACCPETGAARKVLEVLEGSDEPLQARLLLRLLKVAVNPSVFVEFRRDEARKERLLRALRKLAGSANPSFRWRADSLLTDAVALGWVVTQDELAQAVDALAAAPEPADAEERDVFFLLLKGAVRRGSEKIRSRVEAMARHESSRIRASAALIFGHSAGGKDRRRDVLESLRLLEDRDPLVRGASASALGVIFTTSAFEPYTEGWDGVRGAIQRKLQEESDPAARGAMERAVKEGDGRDP